MSNKWIKLSNGLWLIEKDFFGRETGRLVRWEPKILKNGKKSLFSENFYRIYYTPLKTCEICGFKSTPKKIQDRNGLSYWWLPPEELLSAKIRLCMSCWNKIRPLVKQEEQTVNNRKLLNKLIKEIANERKNQKHRGIEGVSCQDDARS